MWEPQEWRRSFNGFLWIIQRPLVLYRRIIFYGKTCKCICTQSRYRPSGVQQVFSHVRMYFLHPKIYNYNLYRGVYATYTLIFFYTIETERRHIYIYIKKKYTLYCMYVCMPVGWPIRGSERSKSSTSVLVLVAAIQPRLLLLCHPSFRFLQASGCWDTLLTPVGILLAWKLSRLLCPRSRPVIFWKE